MVKEIEVIKVRVSQVRGLIERALDANGVVFLRQIKAAFMSMSDVIAQIKHLQIEVHALEPEATRVLELLKRVEDKILQEQQQCCQQIQELRATALALTQYRKLSSFPVSS